MLMLCFSTPLALRPHHAILTRSRPVHCCAQSPSPATAAPVGNVIPESAKPRRRRRRTAVVDNGGASAREVRVAELKSVRAARMKALWEDPAFRERMSRIRRKFSPEECSARSERMRARWSDPELRATFMDRREGADFARRASEAAKLRWQDPAYRERMSRARMGRLAWNKGVSPSNVTRLRMSIARRGVPKTLETRRKMSEAKIKGEGKDSWRMLISESKRGKTKEYFQMRREFRALHRDLKLWSDLYRAKHGRLPDAKSCDTMVAPMMVFRIRRYLTLRESFAQEEKKVLENKIID